LIELIKDDNEFEDQFENLNLNLFKSIFEGNLSIANINEKKLELEPTYISDTKEDLKNQNNSYKELIELVGSHYKVNVTFNQRLFFNSFWIICR
jgi:hypothetical protein